MTRAPVALGAMRLPPQPGEVIDRERPLALSWDGRRYPAFPGDTIVSALAASGVRVFSRSFKYHRPRGILTADYWDPGCLLQVADEPNVRGAHRRVAPGMTVTAQNAWPSLRFDAAAASQAFARLLPPGFYYKTFKGPRPLRGAYRSLLRRFAPGGSAPARESDAYFDKHYAHPDVLVVGGGRAGLAAAAAAAAAGAAVLLVEQEHDLGGHARWGGAADHDRLRPLLRAVRDNPAIEVLTNAVATGRYDDNWVSVVQRGHTGVEERLIKARAKMLVVAPGLIERPYVFAGNDLPGVILSGAARRLINLYAVKPGQRAVIFTANAQGDAAALDLERVGVEVVRVVDARQGGDIVRARGRGRVRAVELGDGTRVEADLLVTATGWTAPLTLLTQSGATPRYDERAARFLPQGLPDNVLATGGIAGDGDHETLLAHARATGRTAARRASATGDRWRAQTPSARDPSQATPPGQAEPVPALPLHDHPALFLGSTHGFIDFSEDVSSKDLKIAAGEGYDAIELAKRYTTAGMGPAQGKLEMVNAAAALAAATGRRLADIGGTTWRPPYAPVTLGALAGRRFEPKRVSPIQPWHEQAGARPLVAGQWIRPEHYGDPAGEVRNVRTNVGLIDVTPLGKFDLRGPDVSQLLNLLYVNRWSKLGVGRVRYGVMCANDGVILDDGVTGRLSQDHYLMTTTSSGPETAERWIREWLQTEYVGLRVQLTPITSAFASINVAGPRSRELMQRLVENVDLSPSAFPYMHVRSGRVAGVDDCVMWRIGFTGELSFELHIPAGYGLHVWEALLAAGADLGVAPFGIEAQRVMRLEKGHFLVGQDTDGLTQGFAAGLGGLIKLDKPDFAGKRELRAERECGDPLVLVGLQPVDATLVPPEACQLMEGANNIVGRITSSRMSPTLGRSICLGLLAPHLAEPGRLVDVRLTSGARVPVRVMPQHAHFDPEGERLRG